jgi:heat shock protein HslJ
MGCPNGSLGSQFTQMLDGDHTVTWHDGDLTLTGADGGKLDFAPALTGVIWRWVPTGGSSATPALWVGVYSVAFEADGALAVVADCNRGKSTYVANGGALAIRDIAMTRAACPEGTLIDQFVRGLHAATAYAVNGGQLELTTMNQTWRFTPAPAPAATPES